MKCNCKSAGSRNTALAFINDVACVSKKGRRVKKTPFLHLLAISFSRLHEEKKADMQKCMKKSSIAWGKAIPCEFEETSRNWQGQRKGALVLPTMATESAVHILFCNKL